CLCFATGSCVGSSALAMSLNTGWMTWNLKPIFCATRTLLTIDIPREPIGGVLEGFRNTPQERLSAFGPPLGYTAAHPAVRHEASPGKCVEASARRAESNLAFWVTQ